LLLKLLFFFPEHFEAAIFLGKCLDGWTVTFADACTFLRVLIRYITSDCDAVSIIHDAQGYAKTAEDAVADVLKAGMSSLLITMHKCCSETFFIKMD